MIYINIFLSVILIVLTVFLIRKQLLEYYNSNEPKINQLRKLFNNFFLQNKQWPPELSMLNNSKMVQNVSLYRGNKSYTINKHKIFLCLKDGNKQYYPDNTLIYVLAHEYAHVLCPEIGHTKKFDEIFKALLKELTREGIFDPTQPIEQDYCKLGDDEI
jgi:hypothetical protein